MFLQKGGHMGNAENEELAMYLREKIVNTIEKCKDIDCLMYLEKFSRLFIQKKENSSSINATAVPFRFSQSLKYCVGHHI